METITVDCQACPRKGTGCDECVVGLLLGPAMIQDDSGLTPDERRAVGVLRGRGLVAPDEVGWAWPEAL